MTTRVRHVMPAVFLLALTASSTAAQSKAPQPSAEHSRLGYYVGTWKSHAEMKPSPMGPGGQASMTETCEWFAGSFHVICRSEGKGPMGDMRGFGILGYDAERKIYTYYGIDNAGHGELSTGTVTGKVWTWTSESMMGGKAMKSRFTIAEESPTTYSYKWEVSSGGGPLTVVMEGKSSKVK